MNQPKDEAPQKAGSQGSTKAEGTKSPAASGAIKEIFVTLLWAFVIAVVVRTFAFEPFNIPSGSMKPTLLVGDYLFVSKYSYGYSRFSFPSSLELFEGRIFGSAPERGDVAIFRKPPQNAEDYIKRVIGLPGDRIQVIDGLLHINGEAVKREFLARGEGRNDRGRTYPIAIYRETLPNGVEHLIWEESDRMPFADNTREFLVPKDRFFMMGDNRDHSQDSRMIGAIPLENFVGRAEITFFSHNGTAKIYQPWKWPWAIRYGRIFDAIE